jgi:carboxymethylenebutenolidase
MTMAEFRSLVPGRDFVCTSIGSGFAAAVLPVMAQTVITTDSVGLVSGELMIPAGNFKMPACRAAPAGRQGAPVMRVVRLVSETFGVHEHIADLARRFAKAGHFAIAPELFVRQSDAGSYGEIGRMIAEVVSKVPDAQVIAALDASLA